MNPTFSKSDSGSGNGSPKSIQNGPEVDGIGWPAPLLDGLCAIASRKWIVAAIAILGLVFGSVRLVNMPKIYKASAVAVLMPREKPNLDAAIDTNSIETSDDRASRSQSGNLMLPPNPALYTTIMGSRATLTRIAEKFNERLGQHISSHDRSIEVYLQLKSMITMTSTEEGLITVSVASQDPSLSSDIANELFEECRRASQSIERQLILQQAGHLDKALESARIKLEESENRLKGFTSRNSVVDIELQAGNQLRSIRELEAKKAELKADLFEMQLNYSSRSPEITRLKARIASIEAQEKEASNRILGDIGSDNYGSLVVEHESLLQRIQFERDLVATLNTKADIYRIRAEQPTGNLAIIRAASPPKRHTGPSKKRELGIVLALSLVLGFGWAIAMDQWGRARSNEYVENRLQELKSQLSLPLLRTLFSTKRLAKTQ